MNIIKSTLIYLCFLLLFLLIAMESLLRIFGVGDTRTESIGQGYHTYYDKTFPSWYWTSTPNITYRDESSDFSFEVKTNSLGHREREPEEVFGISSSIRIIALGDSFTEGAGAPQDSTYVSFLEKLVNVQTKGRTAIYNAGTSGSDPVFCYVQLRDKLTAFHPDIIIQAINGSDYVDYKLRGGFERFRPDSTCTFSDAPWVEPLYHYSYVFRILLIINGYAGDVLARREDFVRQCEEEINPAFIAVADSFNELGKKNGFKNLFVIHPTYGDFMNDEMERLHQQLASALSAKGYCVADVWQPMRAVIAADNIYHYGYEHDLHFTSAGYRLMAQAVFDQSLSHCPGWWNKTGTTLW